MKPYLLPIFALLIIGYGNRNQANTTVENVEEIKKIPSDIVARIKKDVAQYALSAPYTSTIDSCEIELEAINGDFNGDGKIDTAYLYGAEKPADDNTKPSEPFKSGIIFSDISVSISFIPGSSTMGDFILNEGDIDNNGADEIGYFDLSESRYIVYSFRRGKWEAIVNMASVRNDNYQDLVKITPDRKGYAIMTRDRKGYTIIKKPDYDITTGPVGQLRKIE